MTIPKRTAQVLIVLAIVYAGYHFLNVAINAKRADVSMPSAIFKAGECAQNPTSPCLAELAILNLPPHYSFNGVNDAGIALRYVGFGHIVDANTESDIASISDSQRTAQRLYESVSSDIEAFRNSDPVDNVTAFSLAYAFLQGNAGHFTTADPAITAAESAAFDRRSQSPISERTLAFLEKWRESLELHATYSYEWLRYATRAREWDQLQQARDALEHAEAFQLSDRDELALIRETFQLYGKDAVVERTEEIENPNVRAEAYLDLADSSLRSGDKSRSSELFTRYLYNYDRDGKVRHLVVWIHMANRAARVAHELGDIEAAKTWTDRYARETGYYQVPDRVSYSGELYADIGSFSEAAAIAREAIAYMEAKSDVADHASKMGRAIGLLCRAGEFESAYELAGRNADYGREASIGCFSAIQGEMTLTRLSEVERRLGEYSKRPMRTALAARLIEQGNYRQSAEIIEEVLQLPPRFSTSTRATENLQLLRLAVAMRDEPLARTVMRSVVRDSSGISGRRAVHLYATAAAFTKNWPDDPRGAD